MPLPAAFSPIYMDHHATTPVDPAVLAAMLPYFSEAFGNPSGRQHAFGQAAHAAVEHARSQVAALVGALPGDIVFTSGATEADNLALKGLVRDGHVVTTTLEHSAVLEPCRTLEAQRIAVTRVPVGPDGIVDVDDVTRALRPDTALVSVMAANNEIGTLQPIAAIGALCRARGIPFHTDAVQAVGHVPVDVSASNVDLMSISAHKMYGPKGVGALYVRRERRPRLKLRPLQDGGGQERGLRAGTLNVAGIVGMGAAAERAAQAIADGSESRIALLRDRLYESLQGALGGIRRNGAATPRLPGNLHVSIEGAEAETLILAVGGRVALSSGAACAEAGGQGSHVLRALGFADERVFTSVRFGLGRQNTQGDVDVVVGLLAEEVTATRARAAVPRT
jgi:cysteine desulfurase